VFVWNRCEILFLEHFSTIENVAFFSISFGAAQSVVLASRVASSAAGMTLMAESGRAPARVGALAGEVAYFIALLSVPLAAFAVGLASPVIELAYGARFAPAAAVLSILAAFTPFRAVFFAGQHLLVAKDDQRPLIRASVLGAAADVLLALLLIPAHGAVGAALTKGLTVAFTTVATWQAIGRRHGVRLPLKRLAGLLVVGAVSALAMRLVASSLPAWAGLPSAAVLGFALLTIGIRLVGALDAKARDRLLQLGRMMPGTIGRAYVLVVRSLAASRNVPGVP
jgi:O-antigen/teichoic acid export membrane protein